MGHDELQALSDATPLIPGGAWGLLVFAITVIGLGLASARAWWRKNTLDDYETRSRINSLSDLQAILAAERAEKNAMREAFDRHLSELRTINNELHARADRFAVERNELVLRIGEMTGEVRALRQELDSLKALLETRGELE